MNKLLSKSDGMTLVEALVTVALASVMMLTAYTFLLFIQNRAQQLLTMQTRDSLQSQLLQNLSDYKTIAKSRALDPVFDACFLGGTLRAKCPGQQETGVSIHHISGSLLSGSPDKPAYFTFLGMPCTWPSPNCVIKVTSYVRAQGVPWWQNGQLVGVRDWDFGNETLEIHFTISMVNTTGIALRDLTGSVIYDIDDVLSDSQVSD